ncbi:MAG: P-II family nitrogen regulator [Thermodesulfobacteriota bacterium]
MKEIKSYFRMKKAEEVIYALEDAGVPGFTLVEVKALGGATVPEAERFSVEYSESYSPLVKLELVCDDGDMDRIAGIIREKAYTGHRGDGMIFCTDVCEAIKIRTGQRGAQALKSEEPD